MEKMMRIVPNHAVLGAQVQGIDLARPLNKETFEALMMALGQHGVLEFPDQDLTTVGLKQFSANFGELWVSPGGRAQDPEHPEVMFLSNMKEDGKPLGLADAGQSWHTDMSYARMIALANVLYGIEVPHDASGTPLGDTQFLNMHKVYEDLPESIKKQLEGKTITHDFNKFWEMMRQRPGSTRPPLGEKEKAARPPVQHPAFLTHPITGKKVLYANPGYAMFVNDMPREQSDELLQYLFEFQTQPEYLYSHQWKKRSVLMWDNIGTTHNAVADYTPEQHRFMKRCQVMATRFYGAQGTAHPIMFKSTGVPA